MLILDFSFAGYKESGAALLVAPAVQALSPSGRLDTATIQAATDTRSDNAHVMHTLPDTGDRMSDLNFTCTQISPTKTQLLERIEREGRLRRAMLCGL